MSLEDFSANLEQEGLIGEKAFERPTEETAKETPSATPTDTKPEGKPSQGGENTNTPVVPQPPKPTTSRQQREESRWQKAQEELARLRKYEADTKPRLETYEQMLSRLGKEDGATTQIPDWFPKTGNQKVDEQKYKEYLSYESGVKAQIKQELLEEQSQEAQRKSEEQEKWKNWVNESLDKLEDSGKVFDRNELQAIALKYLPSDAEGNIDFGKAYEIMTELKKVQVTSTVERSEARKKIGDLTNTSKQTSEQAKPKFETQRSLRNRSFDQLIRESN